MTNDLRFRGLVTVRNSSTGNVIAECRTSKSYSTGFRALNEAETLANGFASDEQLTADIAVEYVKAVALCEVCNEIHYGWTSARCRVCGSQKMSVAEMEVMF